MRGEERREEERREEKRRGEKRRESSEIAVLLMKYALPCVVHSGRIPRLRHRHGSSRLLIYVVS
jgi:hypothetical protein